MKKNSVLRTLAIIIIVAISVGIAFGIDAGLDAIEKYSHPKQYEDIVKKYSAEYNIPEYVIFAVIKVESDFEPLAKSSANAMGLMQMTPDTFRWLTGSQHLAEHLPTDALYIPDVSIRYGCYYLLYLYRKFNYDWDLTFAAYNAGEGNVAKWLADDEYCDEDGNLVYIPFRETRSYVKKVNSAIEMYKKLYYINNQKESESTKA